MRKHVDFLLEIVYILKKKSYFGLKGNFDGVFVDIQ